MLSALYVLKGPMTWGMTWHRYVVHRTGRCAVHLRLGRRVLFDDAWRWVMAAWVVASVFLAAVVGGWGAAAILSGPFVLSPSISSHRKITYSRRKEWAALVNCTDCDRELRRRVEARRGCGKCTAASRALAPHLYGSRPGGEGE